MRTFRRTMVFLAVVAMMGLFAQGAHADALSDEQRHVQLINLGRAGIGLAPLAMDDSLVASARAHSARMAASNDLYHNPNLAADFSQGGWSALGENVAIGWGADLIHGMFMNSPGHRANILGDYDRVGVGVVELAGGMSFVTEVFWKSAGAAPAGAATASEQAAGSKATTVTVRKCRKVGKKTICKKVQKKVIKKKKAKKARRTRR